MIIVIDFGSQLTQNICRRIREQSVCAVLVAWQFLARSADALAGDAATLRATLLRLVREHDETATERIDGIVLSGGPATINAAGAPNIPRALLEMELPVLGICFGLQWIIAQCGGKVVPSNDKREFGRTGAFAIRFFFSSSTSTKELHRVDDANHPSPLFDNMPRDWVVWQSHNDIVDPVRFACLQSTFCFFYDKNRFCQMILNVLQKLKTTLAPSHTNQSQFSAFK